MDTELSLFLEFHLTILPIKAEALLPHMSHEEGIGVHIVGEITIYVLSQKPGHLSIMVAVKFGDLSNFAGDSLYIIL